LATGSGEGHLVCKKSAPAIPKSLLLGISVTWSNSGKEGRLSKNRKYEYVCLSYQTECLQPLSVGRKLKHYQHIVSCDRSYVTFFEALSTTAQSVYDINIII